jgi:hypothetical protein
MEVVPMERRYHSSRRMVPLPVQHSPELQDELQAIRSSDFGPSGIFGP